MELNVHSFFLLFSLYGRRRKTAHMAQVFPTGDAIRKRGGGYSNSMEQVSLYFPK